MRRIFVYLLTGIFLFCLGCTFLFASIILTGFQNIPGDLGDSRLVNLLLEHNVKFWTVPNLSFWSPFWQFYPVENSFAMSDILTGSSFLYTFWRIFNFDPQTSFQLWLLSCTALNFLAMGVLCLYFRFSFIATLIACYFYAFAATRGGFLSHPQLTPTFYMPLALTCFLAMINTRNRNSKFMYAVFFGSLAALQITTAFYLGYFLILGMTIFSVVFLSFKKLRAKLGPLLRANFWPYVIGILIFIGISGPVLLKYLKTSQTLGSRDWTEITHFLPPLRALIFPNPDSFLYHSLYSRLVAKMPGFYSEMFLFSGFYALLIPFAILLIGRFSFLKITNKRLHIIGLLSAVCALVILACAVSGKFSLWKILYDFLPGAKGIRAPGRLGHLLIVPTALAIGYSIMYLQQRFVKWGMVLGVFIGIIVITENAGFYRYSFSKTENSRKITEVKNQLTARAPCDAFYLSSSDFAPLVNITAMWASIETGIPTINGYSGFEPIGYKDAGLFVPSQVSMTNLQKWLSQNNKNLKNICHIVL